MRQMREFDGVVLTVDMPDIGRHTGDEGVIVDDHHIGEGDAMVEFYDTEYGGDVHFVPTTLLRVTWEDNRPRIREEQAEKPSE